MGNKRKTLINNAIMSVLILLVVAFIFSNSVQSPSESGAVSGRVMQIIEKIFGEIPSEHRSDVHFYVRKLGHFLEFMLYGISLFLLFDVLNRKHSVKLFPYALFLGLFVGVIDEFIQSHTGRGSSVRDVMIDFFGFLCGYSASFVTVRFIGRIKRKRQSAIKIKKEDE